MQPTKNKPLSAIDLGTNTVLMVTGVKHGTNIEILDDAYTIARMGQGVDANRCIAPEAIQRVCAALITYRRQAEALGSTAIGVYGTSALRDAGNRAAVIAQVKNQVNLTLETLPGETEARLTYEGAGYGMSLPAAYAVLDIGGGSTEWAVGHQGVLSSAQSLDIGSVRLSERFFPQLPPQPKQIKEASEFIQDTLSKLPTLPAPLPLIGVAGTVTTLGAIDMGIMDSNIDTLNGHFLSYASIQALSKGLLTASLEEITALPQILPQRADIISAGALILRAVMDHFSLPGILVSTRGIRYALLTRMFAENGH